MMNHRMLSKEDEATAGSEENEVRREDQEKINRFSRLHQRESVLEEQLKAKQKDKEDLEEISTELELADEDELVPYVFPSVLCFAFIYVHRHAGVC
jgi:prefoldin subunit 4